LLLKKALIQSVILILYSNARNSIKDVDINTIDLLNNYFFIESGFNFSKLNNISYISLFNINSNIIISSEICNSELPINVEFNKTVWGINNINRNFESHLNYIINEINLKIDNYKNNNSNVQILFILFLFFKAIIICILYLIYTSINLTNKNTDPNVYYFNKFGLSFLTAIPYIGENISILYLQFSDYEKATRCRTQSYFSNSNDAYNKCLIDNSRTTNQDNDQNNYHQNDQNDQNYPNDQNHQNDQNNQGY
jgi:hypothetical protein